MNYINRALPKRRRGMIRSVIILILLAAMVVLQFFLVGGDGAAAAQERAAFAVRQVAARFNQLVEDGFRQLNLASAVLPGGDEEAVLRGLQESGTFSDAALISGSVRRDADGVESRADRSGMYILHGADGVNGRIIVQSKETVQLSVPTESGELTARLNAQELEEVFQSAYSGDYSFALFNSATGVYIINHTSFEETNYYDTLLGLNEAGRASKLLYSAENQAYIDGKGAEGGYYIAHCRTGVQPWSLALFLPEEMVATEAAAELDVVALVVALLQLVLLALYVLHLVRRFRAEGRMEKETTDVYGELLGCLARDAGSALYVYSRESDGIESSYDGMDLLAETPRSISGLARACGVEDEEADELYKRMRALKPGEKAEMKCEALSAEAERRLCFRLHCTDDGKRVICIVKDNAAEEERIGIERAEEEFHRQAAGRCSSVWQINATQNRWRMTDGTAARLLKLGNGEMRSWRSCSGDIGGALRESVLAQDYDEFARAMSPETIIDLLRTGMREASMEFRAKGRACESHEWQRMTMRIYRAAGNGDVMAYVYMTNVDAEKNAELERRERARILQQTLTALGGIYYGLYYIDLDGDLSYAAKAYDGKLSSQLRMPFKATFKNYVERFVHADDQAALLRLFDPYYLRKSMTENSHLLRQEYRRRVGEDYEWAAVVVQAARFENGTLRDAVVAMRKIDHERDLP